MSEAAEFVQRVDMARRSFFRDQQLPQRAVADPVVRSWERSRRLGLHTSDKALFNPVSLAYRRQVEERSRDLLGFAAPEMRRLHESLGPSKWIVALVDARGTVVKALGNTTSVRDDLSAVFRTGVRLSENAAGTTGPGCAIAEGAPVVINANEHYLDEARVFSCAAVPLFDPSGELMGALDASCRFEGKPLTLLETLIVTGRAVENRILRHLPGAIVIGLHHRADLVGTPLEAILAFDRDGRLLGANQSARQLLGLDASPAALSFDSLFDAPVPHAIDRLQRNPETPLVLECRTQIRVNARWIPRLERTSLCKPQPSPVSEPSSPPRARKHGLSPMREAELDAIENALRMHDGNVSAAARYLGIGRATIYRKLSRSSQ